MTMNIIHGINSGILSVVAIMKEITLHSGKKKYDLMSYSLTYNGKRGKKNRIEIYQNAFQ